MKTIEHKMNFGNLEISRSETEDVLIRRSILSKAYIKLSKKKIFRTKEVVPSIFVDFDKNGKIVGIEVL